jgi:hypothetical protein
VPGWVAGVLGQRPCHPGRYLLLGDNRYLLWVTTGQPPGRTVTDSAPASRRILLAPTGFPLPVLGVHPTLQPRRESEQREGPTPPAVASAEVRCGVDMGRHPGGVRQPRMRDERAATRVAHNGSRGAPGPVAGRPGLDDDRGSALLRRALVARRTPGPQGPAACPGSHRSRAMPQDSVAGPAAPRTREGGRSWPTPISSSGAAPTRRQRGQNATRSGEP